MDSIKIKRSDVYTKKKTSTKSTGTIKINRSDVTVDLDYIKKKLNRYSDLSSRYSSWLDGTGSYLSRTEDENSAEILPTKKSNLAPKTLREASEISKARNSKSNISKDIKTGVTEWKDPKKADYLKNEIEGIKKEAAQLLEDLEYDKQYMTDEGYAAYKELLTSISKGDNAQVRDAISKEAALRTSIGSKENYKRAAKEYQKRSSVGITPKMAAAQTPLDKIIAAHNTYEGVPKQSDTKSLGKLGSVDTDALVANKIIEDITRVSHNEYESAKRFRDIDARYKKLLASSSKGKLSAKEMNEVVRLQKYVTDLKERYTYDDTVKKLADEYGDLLRDLYVGNSYILYTGTQFASGLGDYMSGIEGLAIPLLDIATGGEASAAVNKIDKYFRENPEDFYECILDPHNGPEIHRIAQNTGANPDEIRLYVNSNRGNIISTKGTAAAYNVSDTYKNTVGMMARQVGNQIPTLAISLGLGAAGAVSEGAALTTTVASSIRNAAGQGVKEVLKAGAKGIGKGLLNAARGNLSTWMMGASAAGNKATQNAVESGDQSAGQIFLNHVDAFLTGYTEVFTEGLLGSDTGYGVGKFLDDATGSRATTLAKKIANAVLSTGGEGFEEIINEPLQGFADKLLTDRDKPWVGEGGVFDPDAMLTAGLSGAVIGSIFGTVGTVADIASVFSKSDDYSPAKIKSEAERINNIIDTLPEGYGTEKLNPATATVDTIKNAVSRILEKQNAYTLSLYREQLDVLTESGLALSEDSEAYKLSKNLKEKKNAGEEITDSELLSLIDELGKATRDSDSIKLGELLNSYAEGDTDSASRAATMLEGAEQESALYTLAKAQNDYLAVTNADKGSLNRNGGGYAVQTADIDNNSLLVSGTGENVLEATGEAVEMGEIVDFTADGMPVFEIGGERVSAHEIEFKDEQTANLYVSTNGMSIGAANEMIALAGMLPEGSDVTAFADDFKYAYEIGLAREGTDSPVWKRAKFKIDGDVADLARSMGEADMNARIKLRKEKNKKAAAEKSSRRGTIDKSELGKGTKIPAAANDVSQVLVEAGYNIRFIEDSGSDDCGSYNADTNTITINVANVRDRSGVRILMGETLSHEITHSIQKWDPDGYEELKSFIRGKLGEERFLQRVGEIMEAQGLTYTKAVDEVVAEGCERMLEKSKALSEFAKDHKGIFEKIKENVEKFLSRIRDAVKALYGNERADVRSVAHELEAYADEMQKIFDKALRNTLEASAATVDRSVQSNANEKAPAPVGEVQYKIKYPSYTESDIKKNIQTVANMTSVYNVPASKLNKTEKSPKEIFDSFFKQWDYNISTDVFGDIAVKNSSVRSEVRHGITAEKIASIEAIPTVIIEGKVIFAERKHGTNVERIVVAAPIRIGKTQYYMGVMLQRDSQNQRLYIHDVEIDEEMNDSTPVDLNTTGTGENNNHLFVTNILQKVLYVKYSDEKSTEQHRRKRKSLIELLRGEAKTQYEKEIIAGYAESEDDLSAMKMELDVTAQILNNIRYIPYEAKVKTELSTVRESLKDARAELREAEKDFDRLYNEDTGADYNIRRAGDSVSDELTQRKADTKKELQAAKERYENALKKVKELEKREKELKKSRVSTEAAKRINSQLLTRVDGRIETLENRLNELTKKQEEYAHTYKPTEKQTEDAKLITKLLGEQIKSIKTSLEKAKARKNTLEGASAQIEEALSIEDAENVLQKMRIELSREINAEESRLLQLPKLKIFRDLIERERRTVRRDMQDTFKAQQKESREGQEKTILKNRIKLEMSRLDTLLSTDSVKKHIPSSMKSTVAALGQAIDRNGVDYESRIRALQARMKWENEKQREATQALIEKYETGIDAGKVLAGNLEELYAQANTEGSTIFDQDVYDDILALATELKGKPLYSLSKSQLEWALNVIKEVKATIANADRIFNESKSYNDNSSKCFSQVQAGLKVKARDPIMQKIHKALEATKFEVLKSWAVFELTESEVWVDRYKKLQAREGVYARNVMAANEYYVAAAKKFGITNKMLDKKITPDFEIDGKHYEFTVNQLMSIYCSRGDPDAKRHLLEGGFLFADGTAKIKDRDGTEHDVIKENKREAKSKVIEPTTAIRINEAQINALCNLLTKEQQEFADAIQKYMAEHLANLGNEVSMAMYDIKQFKNKKYFPIQTLDAFRRTSIEATEGKIEIKNAGMFKDRVKMANNPIVIDNFTRVFGRHTNKMLLYHAFTLELENMKRLYNYRPRNAEGAIEADSATMKSALGAIGKQIEDFMRDVNGGVRTEATGTLEKIADNTLSLSKAAATGASLSVMIQQPTAVVRAFSMIGSKYFIGMPRWISQINREWEECQKYTSTASVKELGGVDVNTSPMVTEAITKLDWKKQKFSQNVKGANNVIAFYLAGYMDRITWVNIWLACKREAKANNKTASAEDIKKLAAEKFDLITNRTQVYDSVFSRAKCMRRKNLYSKMTTSFMAEPLTTANMVIMGVHDINKGIATKDRARVARGRKAIVHGVIPAIIINNALVSLVYAMRDDDEDEAFLEKWIEAFGQKMLADINPLSYIPVAKDIISLVSGYSVDRMDMAMFETLFEGIQDFIKVFSKEDADTDEQIEAGFDLFNGIISFLGVPLSNIKRDIVAIGQTFFGSDANIKESITRQGLLEAVNRMFEDVDVMNNGKFVLSSSTTDKLYRAIMAGDEKRYDQLTQTMLKEGKDSDQIESVIVEGLKKNDERVAKAAEAKYDRDFDKYEKLLYEIVSDGFAEEFAIRAINSSRNELIPEEKSDEKEATAPDHSEGDAFVSKYDNTDVTLAIDAGDLTAAQAMINDIYSNKYDSYIAKGKTQKDASSYSRSAIKTSLTNEYKPSFVEGDRDERNQIAELLLGLTVDGKALYKLSDFNEWDE